MIKMEENKINVYSKFDKDSIKGALVCFVLAAIVTIPFYFITKSIIFIILGIISIISFIISFRIYKNADKEKLSCSLSKNEFIIYKNKKQKKFDVSKISNFAAIPGERAIENDVILNYVDENGKNKSMSFLMKGCKNTEFVNLANKFIKEDNANKGYKSIDENKYNKDNSKKVIDELADNKKIKCTVLGKTKIFISNGSGYTLGDLYTKFVFVDENKNIFDIDSRYVKINFETFDNNYLYEMVYDKKSDSAILEKTSTKTDPQIINDFKEDIVYSSKIAFDKDDIVFELNFFNKFIKGAKMFGIGLLLILCTVFLAPTFTGFAACLWVIAFGFYFALYPYNYVKKKKIKKII